MADIDKLKITIDRDECIGDGLCANEAPETFEMDDDTKAVLLEGSTDSRECILDAGRSCPVGRCHHDRGQGHRREALSGRVAPELLAFGFKRVGNLQGEGGVTRGGIWLAQGGGVVCAPYRSGGHGAGLHESGVCPRAVSAFAQRLRHSTGGSWKRRAGTGADPCRRCATGRLQVSKNGSLDMVRLMPCP
jgi:ferredoxin